MKSLLVLILLLAPLACGDTDSAKEDEAVAGVNAGGTGSGSGDGTEGGSTGGAGGGGTQGGSTGGAGGGGATAPVPFEFEGASGERGDCRLGGPDEPKLEGVECEDRTLPGTGHEYCIMAHPDCANPEESCPLYIMFNQGNPRGTSGTVRQRLRRPRNYGKIVLVGGGSSAEIDAMAELPRAAIDEYPGIDQNRIYALGNSRGAGAINNIFRSNDSPYGTVWDIYSAVVIFGGKLRIPDNYAPERGPHALVVNGWDDNEEAGDVDKLARINGCSDPESGWVNVEASDPYVWGGDGSDIAMKRSFGDCQAGDVLAYRFKDEGHVLDYNRHFQPEVRAILMAWDFFRGRAYDGGLDGSGSACYAGE
jgi:hypothetical protein